MITLLKLGGSLITDKTRPYTPRLETLNSLAAEIATIIRGNPEIQLILGHGSGSFGHEAASKFNTRLGVFGPEKWKGFAEVWFQASALNRLVVEVLRDANLPVVTLPPFPAVTAHDGKIIAWDLAPLKACVANGLLPILHGDVVIDEVRGGTILSTEDIFSYLALNLQPKKILLAGLEQGVWKDFPNRETLLKEITPITFAEQTAGIGRSAGADVTGGMETKVKEMLKLVEQVPNLDVLIFSGKEPVNIFRAIKGENPGTRLHN